MRKFFALIISTFVFIQCFSQFTVSYLEVANKFYQKEDYISAIHYFEKYLSPYSEEFKNSFNPYSVSVKQREIKESDNAFILDALYKTADSYRKLSIHDKAATFYKEVLKKKATKYPLAKFYCATELKFLGQYEEAKTLFENFVSEYKKNDRLKQDAQKELASINLIKAEMSKKDNKYFVAKPLILEYKDTGAHYGPIFLDDQSILLNSTRANYDLTKGVYQNRVFNAKIRNEFISNYLPVLALTQSETDHQGASSLSEDGKELYLTRWNYTNGKKYSSIYISRKTNIGWSEPEPVYELNDPASNTQQPFVTKVNGKKTIFFASDRKGGMGGYDLYVVALTDSNKFDKIINLGKNINTEFDEVAPYYNALSKSLVFSNNGRIGMGGFDLFGTEYPETNNVISNLGYPINSIKDDVYFNSRSKTKDITKDCWVSSDRFSQCCLQAIHILNTKPDYEIVGRVLNCDNKGSIENVDIYLTDSTGNTKKYSTTSNADGYYKFKVDQFEPFTVYFKLKNFISKSTFIKVPKGDEFVIKNDDICLIPLVEKKSFVLDRIYFDYKKADLKSESQLQLDSLVAILKENPTMEIEINAHTDSIGSDKYNLDLSDARAKSVLNYLLQKGIAKKRLRSKGYGESMPLEPNSMPDGNDNPAGRARNRRCAFTILKM